MHDGHESCGCGCGCEATPTVKPELGRFWQEADGTETVCFCGDVDKDTLVKAIQTGAYTLPLIKLMTGACQGKDCETLNPRGRCCATDIYALIKLYGNPPAQRIGQA